MRVNDRVTNLCYLINKDHDISLKNLGSISEISYITKAEDGHNFLARNHNIYEVRVLYNFGYDLSAGLTETYS